MVRQIKRNVVSHEAIKEVFRKINGRGYGKRNTTYITLRIWNETGSHFSCINA